MTDSYCAPGCPETWVGDRVCDPSCRVAGCGWDAGDCGLEIFQENSVPGFRLMQNWTRYQVCPGIHTSIIPLVLCYVSTIIIIIIFVLCSSFCLSLEIRYPMTRRLCTSISRRCSPELSNQRSTTIPRPSVFLFSPIPAAVNGFRGRKEEGIGDDQYLSAFIVNGCMDVYMPVCVCVCRFEQR